MSYNHFDPDVPDVTAGSRKDEIDATRYNLAALQDMLAGVLMEGFDYAITAGTTDTPTQITFTKGTQVVKYDLTYGIGPTANLVTSFAVSKSTDSGSSYLSIKTCTITYDANQLVSSYAWS
jgi:hypothetical protein